MGNFAEKHPKAAQWIREGGLFIIFSYLVTILKWALLTFLPGMFRGIVGDVEWAWPGINVQVMGVPLTLAVIGQQPGGRRPCIHSCELYFHYTR